MNVDALKEKILALVPQAEVIEGKQYPEVTVPAGKLRTLAKELKESDETYFDYLFNLTAVDWPDQSLGVVYHLTSSKHHHYLVLKVKAANRETPVIDTVSDIWRTAEFHEREAYDLMGIQFKNHPDMRRIFLEENWVGHPLRKDYNDEINIVER
jgi:NADH-quinone oxidoreductase subunit C